MAPFFFFRAPTRPQALRLVAPLLGLAIVLLAAPAAHARNQPPVINNQIRSVAENTANGTNVGIPVVASDPNPGQTLSYVITAGNTGSVFSIIASTGQLQVAGALNFEGTASYALTVQVTDNANNPLSRSATVTVNVTNVNEAPTAVSLSNSTVVDALELDLSEDVVQTMGATIREGITKKNRLWYLANTLNLKRLTS